MPTYVYRRPDGTTFEVFQKISAAALTEDPETGVPVRRVISGGAGLQFKGDGFYQTDYTDKGKPPKSEPSEEKKAPSSEETSGGSKASDGGSSSKGSKPASTSATKSDD